MLAGQLPQIGASAMNELVGVLAPDELKTLEKTLTKVLLAAGDRVRFEAVDRAAFDSIAEAANAGSFDPASLRAA